MTNTLRSQKLVKFGTEKNTYDENVGRKNKLNKNNLIRIKLW